MPGSPRFVGGRQAALQLCIFVVLLLVAVCIGQTTKPLKNDDIRQMVAGGLSDDTIAMTIHSRPCEFDTSVAALIDLKNAGVSQRIMQLMLATPAAAPRKAETPAAKVPKPPTPTAEPAAVSPPAARKAPAPANEGALRTLSAVEICGVRLGVSTFDQVKQMLEQGVKDNWFADLNYYEGRYFDKKGTKSAFRQVSDAYQNYDAQHLVKTVTGFWAYSAAFPRVPFQMFFFRDVAYKVDLGLRPGLIEDLKAALDRQYGKGAEFALDGPGQHLVEGYTWGGVDGRPQVFMVLGTGIYSLSSRPEFYLWLVDDKIPKKSFYCNFFDRALEGAYLEYEEGIEPQRKHSQTRAAQGIPSLSPAATQARPPTQNQAQAQSTPEQRHWKDKHEYDLFQRASRETDPQKKLEVLDEWTNKYPDTDFRVERLALYLNTYKALNQQQQMMDSARKIIAIQPKNLQALYWICALTVSMNDRAPDRLDLGRSSANALLAVADAYFVPANRPAATSDTDWANAKYSTQAAAHGTLDWIATQEESSASPAPAAVAPPAGARNSGQQGIQPISPGGEPKPPEPAAVPAHVQLGQKIAVSALGIEITLREVVVSFGSYHGMRPLNKNFQVSRPENDGVLAITGMAVKGKPAVLWTADIWITDENGQRNLKEEMASLSRGQEFTLLFNVPAKSRKFVLHFGDGLAIDLAPFLQAAR